MDTTEATACWTLVVIFAGCVWWFLIPWIKQSRLRRMLKLLPGPEPQFLVGDAFLFPNDHSEHLGVFLSLANRFKSAGLYRIWLGPFQPICLLTQGRHLESLLTSNRLIEKSNLYRFTHPWLAKGLITSGGEKWKARRKLLTPTFHFRILNTFMPVYNEQAQILTECLQKHATENKGQDLDIFHYLSLCTLDVICETAMGFKLDGQKQNGDVQYIQAIHKITSALMNRIMKPWLWPDSLFNLSPSGRDHNWAIRIIHAFTDDVIKKRRREWESQPKRSFSELTSGGGEDIIMSGGGKIRLAFLDLLFEASDGGRVLSDLDIREEVDTFMFAGHDTTAAATSWTLYLLGHNPDIQKRVHDELDSVFGDSDRNVTVDDLRELKYLEHVIKESARIYPPVPMISRDLTDDLQLDGHIIPKGAICTIMPYLIHRDETVFPDPERFDPDRFLPENSVCRHPYAYIPFSAGPRNCIGQKFAAMEEKVLLSHVLRKFSVTSLQSRDDIKILGDIILRPKDGIKVKLVPR